MQFTNLRSSHNKKKYVKNDPSHIEVHAPSAKWSRRRAAPKMTMFRWQRWQAKKMQLVMWETFSVTPLRRLC